MLDETLAKLETNIRASDAIQADKKAELLKLKILAPCKSEICGHICSQGRGHWWGFVLCAPAQSRLRAFAQACYRFDQPRQRQPSSDAPGLTH
jgi:hypothetical protein